MENNKYHILIVEDDKEIRDGVEIYLKNQGYQVWKASNGKEGLEIVAQEEIHLAILDIMMPVMDGVTMLMKLREQNHEFPVIMLSAKSEEVDKIMGLNMGADDYVTKPFGMGELMARMRVCLRRAGNKEGEPILTCGGLQLNLLEHRVVVEGREVKLTPTEYELLKVMLKYAGRVLTHKQLLKAVWGNEYDTDTHYIRIYMRQLRRKIEPDPAQPKYLITEAGIGYRLLGGE